MNATNNYPPEGASGDRLDLLARTIRDESDAVLALLPDAHARQWLASPAPRPREDTPQRSTGDRPSDPTADTVLDPRRLAVSDAVSRAERVLEHAAHALTERRRALESAIARYDGERS